MTENERLTEEITDAILLKSTRPARNEIAERVARALFKADQDWYRDLPDSEYKGERAERLRLTARAAIAAMREPTDAMVEQGCTFKLGGIPQRAPNLAKSIYRAMIDAALKDTP